MGDAETEARRGIMAMKINAKVVGYGYLQTGRIKRRPGKARNIWPRIYPTNSLRQGNGSSICRGRRSFGSIFARTIRGDRVEFTAKRVRYSLSRRRAEVACERRAWTVSPWAILGTSATAHRLAQFETGAHVRSRRGSRRAMGLSQPIHGHCRYMPRHLN
jgi:hypothetical protein